MLNITKLTVSAMNSACDEVDFQLENGERVTAFMRKRETVKLFAAFDDARQMEFNFDGG